MSDTYQPTAEDQRIGVWLRSAGIAVIAAAALGSVLFVHPAASEVPATDSTCQIKVVGDAWTGQGCDDVAEGAAEGAAD
ncbi:hypothetical protein GCM10009641_78670 [Mycobacterium cookii]|uniref:Uncharacterized protein n=1 Tax=Nocardioides furvisabuli TaxID=375542 RepID=A0ABN2XGM6_9ACTN|nr:hypothetical protein [Nocardioides furvisabuli]